MKKKVYVSFDYDNDKELKNHLISQSVNPESGFDIVDMSIKFALTAKWKKYARKKIKKADVMIVLCGVNTNDAKGVTAEISLSREVNTPYYLIDGRKGKGVFPKGVSKDDIMYKWSWKNLQKIFMEVN